MKDVRRFGVGHQTLNQIGSGIEFWPGSDNWSTWYGYKSVIRFYCARCRKTQDTANIFGDSDEGSRVSQQRTLLNKTYAITSKKSSKEDCQQIGSKRQKRPRREKETPWQYRRMDKEHSEAMSMAANMDKQTTSTADGFSSLRGLLLPQQVMYKPPMFEGHHEPLHLLQVCTHTMHSRPCFCVFMDGECEVLDTLLCKKAVQCPRGGACATGLAHKGTYGDHSKLCHGSTVVEAPLKGHCWGNAVAVKLLC